MGLLALRDLLVQPDLLVHRGQQDQMVTTGMTEAQDPPVQQDPPVLPAHRVP